MCCIFTCCGWMIDLIQRLWTFTMSCCISSAVCCAFITACMAGIALGYNYSLAEYIDLKETNVSVYLKRGIFDDDIAEDMDWRRRKNPKQGQLRSNDLMIDQSEQQEEEQEQVPSGRRKMDESIYESEKQQNFEGSLMKLTAKAPYNPSITTAPTLNPQMLEQITNFDSGSVNQVKAIQSMINARKMMAHAQTSGRKNFGPDSDQNSIEQNLPPKVIQEERIPYFPGYQDPSNPGRRIMVDEMQSSTINSLRLAVPDQRFNDPSLWEGPKKYMQEKDNPESPYHYMTRPTYPHPITTRLGPLPLARTKLTTQMNEPFILSKDLIEDRSRDVLGFRDSIPVRKDNMRLDDINLKASDLVLEQSDEFIKNMKDNRYKNKEEEDYEESFKGLPRRKKRNVQTTQGQILLKEYYMQYYKDTTQNEKKDTNSVPNYIYGNGIDMAKNETKKNFSLLILQDFN